LHYSPLHGSHFEAAVLFGADMADKEKMKQLIWDCQKDIATYLPPESGISEHELLQTLIARLDGSQAREARETIGKLVAT
jgi:hypothetical protein